MLLGLVHRMQTRDVEIDTYLNLVSVGLWTPLEYFRINYGYRGNINETFPELIAFQIFTIFFTLPLSVLPLTQFIKFPHERCVCIINVAFVFFELVYCMILIQNFMRT